MGRKKSVVRRFLLLLIVVVFMGGFLTVKGMVSTQYKKPIVVIHFAHWRVEDLGVYNQIIRQYERENPGILVVQDVEDANEYRKNLGEQLNAENAPDLFATFPGGDFNTISARKAYKDIAGLDFLKQFNPELLKPGQQNGKQYAVPYQLVYNIPIYNKEIFEKYNLKSPNDWNGFLAICQTLKNNGIIPIILDSEIGFQQFINPMIMNNLPEPDTLSKVEKGETKLVEPWFVKTLSQFKELNDRGFFQSDIPGTKKAGAAAMFAQGKGGMLAQGSYIMGTVKQQNPTMRQGLISPITVEAGQKKYEGIHTATFLLGINEKTKNYDAVLHFLQYLLKPEIGERYANATGQLLTVNGINYQSAELAEQALWQSKTTLFQPRYMILIPEVENAIINSIKEVLSGTTPEVAAQKAQQIVDEVIKK